jgi:hypothetical protein
MRARAQAERHTARGSNTASVVDDKTIKSSTSSGLAFPEPFLVREGGAMPDTGVERNRGAGYLSRRLSCLYFISGDSR